MDMPKIYADHLGLMNKPLLQKLTKKVGKSQNAKKEELVKTLDGRVCLSDLLGVGSHDEVLKFAKAIDPKVKQANVKSCLKEALSCAESLTKLKQSLKKILLKDLRKLAGYSSSKTGVNDAIKIIADKYDSSSKLEDALGNAGLKRKFRDAVIKVGATNISTCRDATNWIYPPQDLPEIKIDNDHHSNNMPNTPQVSENKSDDDGSSAKSFTLVKVLERMNINDLRSLSQTTSNKVTNKGKAIKQIVELYGGSYKTLNDRLWEIGRSMRDKFKKTASALASHNFARCRFAVAWVFAERLSMVLNQWNKNHLQTLHQDLLDNKGTHHNKGQLIMNIVCEVRSDTLNDILKNISLEELFQSKAEAVQGKYFSSCQDAVDWTFSRQDPTNSELNLSWEKIATCWDEEENKESSITQLAIKKKFQMLFPEYNVKDMTDPVYVGTWELFRNDKRRVDPSHIRNKIEELRRQANQEKNPSIFQARFPGLIPFYYRVDRNGIVNKTSMSYQVDHIIPESFCLSDACNHPRNYAIIPSDYNTKFSNKLGYEKMHYMGPFIMRQVTNFVKWARKASNVDWKSLPKI